MTKTAVIMAAGMGTRFGSMTEERIREIAQMVSGSDVTEAAISNAKALLKQ